MRSLHLLRFSREPVAPPVRFYHLCRLHNRLVARDPKPPSPRFFGRFPFYPHTLSRSPNPTLPFLSLANRPQNCHFAAAWDGSVHLHPSISTTATSNNLQPVTNADPPPFSISIRTNLR